MATDREKTLQVAQKYVDKKKYDRAIEEYQKIVQQDPNDARTLLKVGDLQARMGAFPEAIATYDRVGQYYANQGFALKAIAVYKQIRELIEQHVPQLADRYGHIVPRLAEIYAQLGLTSDALQAYDEVATRLQRGGRDRDAIAVFRKMVELDATNPLPHLRLAEACCRVQDVNDAIASFWTAAQLLLQLRRRDDALKVIERILHFKAEPQYARVAAELYLERGGAQDGMQALAKLQLCFQADPKNLETLSLLARAFTAIGQETKAVEVYKEMARLARDQGQADLFQQLMAHLTSVVPNDEQVKALASLLPGAMSNPPGAPSVPPSAGVPSGPVQIHNSAVQSGEYAAVQQADPLGSTDIDVNDAELEVVEDDRVSSPPVSVEERRPMMSSGPDVVVVDEGFEGAEEITGPDSFDAPGHARKAVVDAESFRRLKLYSKAMEALHIALEIDPRSVTIREKLREILAEAGDRDGAIGEMISLAQLYIENGDIASAEAHLYGIVEAEPEHAVANHMLEQLSAPPNSAGYYEGAPPSGDYAAADHAAGSDQAPGYAGAEYEAGPPSGYVPAASGYDPNEPLPSYDLEEVSASHAMGADEAQRFDSVDDPFADAPLPSFPLGHEPATAAGTAEASDFSDDEIVDYDGDLIDATQVDMLPLDADAPQSIPEALAQATGGPASIPPAEGIEDVLEEAEFFAARGLYEDAKMILTDQAQRTPNHPLLLEAIAEIESALATESQDQEHGVAGPTSAGATDKDDRAFDIAASLDALDELDDVAGAPSTASPGLTEDVDVDQVFEKFKAGVAEQVSETDSATHYDLGVAYKEMGLLPDAIGEFELAARDATRECMCFAMIGMIHTDQGALDEAIAAYVRGLDAKQRSEQQELSLYYDLGNVYELKESQEEALYYFKKISARDPNYRDVMERIAALGDKSATLTKPSAGDDDEFDRVFDDLFEGKG